MLKEIPFALFFSAVVSQAAPLGSAPYSHGNPTAEEQYMLELINRARTEPKAEGIFLAMTPDSGIRLGRDFFDVNLKRLKSDFAGYAARPPMAFNPQLLASSRRQSKDMAKNNFQDHVGSDGSTISDRIADAGYSASAISESIYSNLVSNTLFAHAGLNIDWGFGVDGIQAGVGHRAAIMGLGAIDYQEIGISIVSRTGADAVQFGKLSITQDFGNRPSSPDFLTGVAYYDVNENEICEPGEGISGLRVQPASGSRHAITSASGGYAIPFSAATGASSVTFSGAGLTPPVEKEFTIVDENVKVDLRITSGVPFVALTVVDKVAIEGGNSTTTQASFRLARIGPMEGELKVILATTGVGPGVASIDDYKLSAVAPAGIKRNTAKPGQFVVIIPSSNSTAEIKFSAVPDKKNEPAEKAVIGIVPSKAYRSAEPQSVKISIKP
jgi:uncharacterized protein YkwD